MRQRDSILLQHILKFFYLVKRQLFHIHHVDKSQAKLLSCNDWRQTFILTLWLKRINCQTLNIFCCSIVQSWLTDQTFICSELTIEREHKKFRLLHNTNQDKLIGQFYWKIHFQNIGSFINFVSNDNLDMLLQQESWKLDERRENKS